MISKLRLTKFTFMNLKPKLDYGLLLLFTLIIIIGTVIFFYPLPKENIKLTDEKSEDLRNPDYEELSPDGLNKIILYHFSFDTSIYRDYYKDYFNNNTIVSVRDMKDGKENYLFAGARIGEPKWLGNEHIFFTSYCGSSCQGIYLVNVFSKETRQGVLSYMISEKNKPVYTHFKNWFDHEFKFDGWVDKIGSETVKDKVYLIFYMRNDEQKSIGQKRFLFTGKTLEEQTNY